MFWLKFSKTHVSITHAWILLILALQLDIDRRVYGVCSIPFPLSDLEVKVMDFDILGFAVQTGCSD